jgi:hypothetical protein
MKRPAFITGIAYIYLLCALEMLTVFGQKQYVGKIPLFIGSAFSVAQQWNWCAAQLLLTVVLVLGLLLGHRWSRWLCLAIVIISFSVGLPVRDARGVPGYLVPVAVTVAIVYLLFMAPTAKAYFSRCSSDGRAFNGRELVITSFHIVGAVLIFAAISALFTRYLALSAAMSGLAKLCLPALAIGVLLRWNLTAACRDVATVLIAVVMFFLEYFLVTFVSQQFIYPTWTTYCNWKDSLVLVILVGGIGVMVAAAYRYRKRRETFCIPAAAA